MRGRRHHHRGPPFRGYFRAHLHRRIFVWFGVTILITGLATGAVMAALSPLGQFAWRREVERIQGFASDRFAHVWDDPAAREELAAATARQLEVGVQLFDPRGTLLSSHGPTSCRRPHQGTVVRGGVTLGEVRVCLSRPHQGGVWRALLALLVGGITLWAATGWIARRLGWPFSELARVARALGEGNLQARAHVGPHWDQESRSLAGAINEMAGRIDRQLADQRELLAAVSHELRTPLGHMRLLIELARGSAADPRALEEIDREVLEIDALVGQLLAKSKLEFQSLHPSPVDPVDAARRALERAGLSAALLTVEGPPPASVNADPTLLSRALANLIDNARKHAGGARAVRVRADRGRVFFEVDDAGPGFVPGEEERVFDAFYRSSQAPTRDPDSVSLGLGLALVRRIAQAHGGSAFARNRDSGGATVGFEVTSL